jgi:hypothetical protein
MYLLKGNVRGEICDTKLYVNSQLVIINLGTRWIWVVKIHDPTPLTLGDVPPSPRARWVCDCMLPRTVLDTVQLGLLPKCLACFTGML